MSAVSSPPPFPSEQATPDPRPSPSRAGTATARYGVAMTEPWLERWILGDEIGSGGQGKTYIATNRFTGAPAALKILRDQPNPERRARMRQEAATLDLIEHPAVPRIIEDNTREFRSRGVGLYLAAEFVHGKSLDKMVRRGQGISLAAATTCFRRILDILDHCHGRRVVHRDIKPGNILARDENIADPLIIDFGLSCNEVEVQHETATNEQLGNRFLLLPELTTGGHRGDERSDYTQALGVYFYLLTGHAPVELRDQYERRPHERPEHIARFAPLEFQRVRTVFSRGFRRAIDERWQTSGDIRRALDGAMPANETADQATARARGLIAKSGKIHAQRTFGALNQQLAAQIEHQIRVARERLGDDFLGGPEGIVTLEPVRTVTVKFRLSVQGDDWSMVGEVGAEVAIDDVVFYATDETGRREFIRVPTRQFAINDDLSRQLVAVQDYLIAIMTHEVDRRLADP